MSVSCQSDVSGAANELDKVLCRGADLYLRTLRAGDAVPVKAVLGFGDIPGASGFIVCLHEEAGSQGSSTDRPVEFPVLVAKGLLKQVRALYTAEFHCSSDPSVSPCSPPSDSLDSSPHIRRASVASKKPHIVALSWLCNPQNECLIAARRLRLRSILQTPDSDAARDAKLRIVLEEHVLVDLLLSVGPKVKALWDYRLWLFTQMINNKLIDDGTSGKSSIVSLSRLQLQDDVAFFIGAQNHPMNYNAWNYRRALFRLFYVVPRARSSGVKEFEQAVESECRKVITFLEAHNGDSSASSYLLFLLRELDLWCSHNSEQARKRKREGKCSLSLTSPPFGSSSALTGQNDKEASLAAPVKLWKTLMLFAQREIRRHCERGHECVWYLRLELVRWAVWRGALAPINSSWTIQDELEWVSTYASAAQDTQLLCPVSALPQAWTDSSGSLAWTSYNAARYGLELITLLGLSTHPRTASTDVVTKGGSWV